MNKMYDRKTNPAAILKVMPCYKNQDFPVAVFIKYTQTPYFWQQISKEYWYRKCAVNRARMIEIEHFAYVFPENSVFAEKGNEA